MFWRRFILAVSLVFSFGPSASAQGGWVDLKDVVQVHLRPGWRRADGRHIAAVEINLASGWKTYWRWPGQAGFVPEASWRGSRNLNSVRFHWPTPTVGLTSGYRTVGYTNRVILPLEVVPIRTDGVVSLKGRLEIGVCAEICIPASFTLRAKLPAAGAEEADIVAALQSRPARHAQEIRCQFAASADGLVLRADIARPRGIGEMPVVAIEPSEAGVWFGDAKLEQTGGRIIAMSRLHSMSGIASVDRSKLRFTIIGTRGAVEILGCRG